MVCRMRVVTVVYECCLLPSMQKWRHIGGLAVCCVFVPCWVVCLFVAYMRHGMVSNPSFFFTFYVWLIFGIFGVFHALPFRVLMCCF